MLVEPGMDETILFWVNCLKYKTASINLMQKSCETVVRRNGNQMLVMKDCKDDEACKNGEMQVCPFVSN